MESASRTGRRSDDNDPLQCRGMPDRSGAAGRTEERTGGRAAVCLAVALGLTGSLFIAFFTQWYEYVVRLGWSAPQVVPFVLAPAVLFMLFLCLAALNPLLVRFLPQAALGKRELVIALCFWLVAGAVCTEGFAPTVIHRAGQFYTASHDNRKQLRALVRPDLFLGRQDATDYKFWLPEDAEERLELRLADVPWGVWAGPLRFWLPFLLVSGLFAMSLVQVCHRQWSEHELLAYPLAEATDLMIGRDERRAFPRVFYTRKFWIGFLLPFGIYGANGLKAWFPQVLEVPLSWDHRALMREFPFLVRYCGTEAPSLFRGHVLPFMVCIAVLIGSEVSLTCWAGHVAVIFAAGLFFLFTGEPVGRPEQDSTQIGMYAAVALMVLYFGRREYARILRHAFTFRRARDPALGAAAAACRVFVATYALLVVLLVYAGLDWLVAVTLVTAFGMVLLIGARAVAEIGLPWLSNLSRMATAATLKLLGPYAIGPTSLAVLAVVGSCLDLDLSNNLAAQQTVCSRLAERTPSLRRTTFFNVLGAALLAAILGATFFTLRNNYRHGAYRERLPRVHLRHTLDPRWTEVRRMQIEGLAEKMDGLRGLAKLGHVQPEKGFVRFFLFGALLVVACSLLRNRLAWWPFHPLPLLFVNSPAMSRLYVSIFLGWLIKTALLRLGGGRTYERSKAFFVGGLFGSVVGGAIWIAVASLDYVATGVEPPRFSFFAP